MTGTIKCVYETPCGWCSKWDKECDEKIMRFVPSELYDEDKGEVITKVVETCQTYEDHVWEPCGISNQGSHYRCVKCGARKIV